MAGLKTEVHIRRFAETDPDGARLEIVGLEEDITIVSIHRPDIFPLVEPFIVSWGGRLGGTGSSQPEPLQVSTGNLHEKKLMMIAIGLLGVTIFFCACAGVLGSVIAFNQGQP